MARRVSLLSILLAGTSSVHRSAQLTFLTPGVAVSLLGRNFVHSGARGGVARHAFESGKLNLGVDGSALRLQRVNVRWGKKPERSPSDSQHFARVFFFQKGGFWAQRW